MDNQKKGSTKLIAAIAAVVVVLGAVAIGFSSLFKTESEPSRRGISFEDIGELATQTAYCTEIDTIDKSQMLFSIKIPFTQSTYIYRYDVIIKAGLDFEEIEWHENGTVIEVILPEAKVLSNEIVEDSLEVYYEKESAFTHISLEEIGKKREELKKKAVEDAIENGLLENAQNNAKVLLTSFFASEYDLSEYEINFIVKKDK